MCVCFAMQLSLPPHCPIPPSTFSISLLLTMGVTLATDDWHRWVMITCIKSSSLRQYAGATYYKWVTTQGDSTTTPTEGCCSYHPLCSTVASYRSSYRYNYVCVLLCRVPTHSTTASSRTDPYNPSCKDYSPMLTLPARSGR